MGIFGGPWPPPICKGTPRRTLMTLTILRGAPSRQARRSHGLSIRI
jgi:hypothetical protein